MTSIASRLAARSTLGKLSNDLDHTINRLRSAMSEAMTLFEHDARDVVDPEHAFNETCLRGMGQAHKTLRAVRTILTEIEAREALAQLSRESIDTQLGGIA